MTTNGTALARPLKTLVPLIKEELEAGDAAGIEHYRRAGEMLIEAKEQVTHGEWQSWVERNFHLSHRTAQKYMQLAGENETRRTRRFSPQTLTEALEPNRERQPSWQEPVRAVTNRVNLEALAQERQSREQESKLFRTLALQLIDIGYKVLAAKLHPDKGGSQEAMARLNKVRDMLKKSL